MVTNKSGISEVEREILDYSPQKQKRLNFIILILYICIIFLLLNYVTGHQEEFISLENITYPPPPF